ncbi:MAG TPA: hypothetical protein VD838_16015 [Anaeromyxobacteraceae bacterium]|nr:hypothetical protein [Anaeromyxobacteraceae bacterium]
MSLIGSFLPDLGSLTKNLKRVYLVRWMRIAQKRALIEWRDRDKAPGVMARFTKDGSTFYDFSERNPWYNRYKGYTPDFVNTGNFRTMLRSRVPTSPRKVAGDLVTTRLKYGGGVLNLLVDRHGEKVRTVTSTTIATFVDPHIRGAPWTANDPGGMVVVKGYQQTRVTKTVEITRATESYSKEFGKFARDREWIVARTNAIFLELWRKAVLTKRGKVRTKYMEGVEA